MQLKVWGETLVEWLALRLNLVPIPLLHAQVLPVVSKAVLEAVDLGIFERIREGHRTAEAIAHYCGLQPKPTEQLLGVLCSVGYLRFKKGEYSLTRLTQKWLLDESASTVGALAVYNNRVVWPWLDRLGDYLRTGQGMDYHAHFTTEQWQLYQRAMWAGAIAEAREFAAKVPMSKNACRMLDIGGAHGLHSVEACRRFPLLSATILDLPAAVAQAAPLLAQQQMGARVQHQAGNILTDPLPADTYDLVLMSSVAHHLTAEQNQLVAYKVAESLKKGGIFVVNEFIRPAPDAPPELVGSSTDLFFGLTSTSGNWSVKEIHQWQTEAGLRPLPSRSYRAIPGRFQVIARK